MKKMTLSLKQITNWLYANYLIFIVAFFTLGFWGEDKNILIINFVLDVIICITSFVLNIILFNSKYNISLLKKMVLLFITSFLVAFTCFAFLMPENGLPPVLFA